ncbi:MAG: lipocalin family protein [Bacteroidota bacterium]
MRNLQYLTPGWIFLALLLFQSCKTAKTVQQLPSQKELIVGEWVVESVNVDGEQVPAALLGGDVKFLFNSDGTAHFTTPDGQTERGRYQVSGGKIFDPDSPADDPVDILLLNTSQLVISMVEQGERMEMTLRNRVTMTAGNGN